jgi:Ca-activated chloride channel family protein
MGACSHRIPFPLASVSGPLVPLAMMVLTALAVGALSLPRGASASEAEADGDRTLSPYFFVHSDDPSTDQLPLKSTEVNVSIAGVIADVSVIQRYRNDGLRPIEAEYVFPGSTRAAVYGLTMTIGERRLVAQIREKQQARAEFTAAKKEGKSAALLEQHRPNVFKMNVANILPGDEISVELRYTELLVPTDAMYEFVFPTVVGPRYVRNTPQSVDSFFDRWEDNPHLRQGQKPTMDFDLKVRLNSGLPIQEAASPSHRVYVHFADARRANVELQPDEKNGANRAFVLRYRLAGDAVDAGVMLYEGKDENYFLAMIEPPRRVTPAQIPPRDYVFIVDVSGSMHGFPLEVTKDLMRNLLRGLRVTDSFNLMLFSGGSMVLSEAPLPATPANINRAIQELERHNGGGGTELLPALKRALALPGAEDRSRSLVVVTDGYVNVEIEAFDLIRQSLGRANLFAFGIGSDVNRFLVEGMARAGQGEPFIVLNRGEAMEQAERLRQYIVAPVLAKAKLTAHDFEISDVEPLGIPDVFAARPVIVMGKWKGKRGGSLRLEGLGGEGDFVKKIDLAKVRPDNSNEALRYLWARHRIARLSDYEKLGTDPDRVQEITQLGLKYSLLTAYTSFIAVDHVVRNLEPGDAKRVRQPLPLPQGVSDLAVGGEVPTSPEPELFVMMGIAGAIAAWARRRNRKVAAAKARAAIIDGRAADVA